jgi:subfamily B ATP-binding cassette protein MsbA
MMLVAASAIAYPWLMQKAFEMLETGDARILTLIPMALVAISAIKALALYGQIVLTNAMSLRAVRSLQQALFAHLQALDIAQLGADAGGLLVSRFTNDVNLIKEALVRASNNLLRDALTLLGALGYMFWANWKMALIILIVYPLATLPIGWIGKRVRALSQAAQQQLGELTALLGESIAGTQMVRSFELEAHEQERANAGFLKRYQLALQLTTTKAMIDPLLEVLGALALAAALAYAGQKALGGASAVPELMGFVTALAILAPSARALGSLSAVWQEGAAAASRAFAVLDMEPTLLAPNNAKPLQVSKGQIEFDQIRFSYDDQIAALANISFAIAPGQTLALVGPSGGGKTSIINLLLKFYAPQSGKITIDGQDISQCSLSSLRHAIALVGQHPILFDDTVRANIAFGQLDASEEDIRAAAKSASALRFILALPNGFDTKVGENGHRLSGGQRQRISIARAILKDAPILLLDEATSALDSRSEAEVQTALEKLAHGRTTLVIAHRLSTVQRADQIMVLDQGKLVEAGTHAQLLVNNGLYASLAEGQFR